MSDIEVSSESTTNVKRGRGRPKKDMTNNGSVEAIKNGTNSLPKKRGRKPAAAPAAAAKSAPSAAKRGKTGQTAKANTKTKETAAGGRRRGRPRKSVESPVEEEAGADESGSASNEED